MDAVQPIVRFGVLTDIQYADCDSKPAWWNPQLIRYYRTALNQIDKAFAHWKRLGKVSFVLQLGDIIDGVNRKVSDPDIALQTVLARLEAHKDIPTFHTVGNHELYNFNRRDLANYFHEYLDRMRVSKRQFGFPNENANKISESGELLSSRLAVNGKNNLTCESLCCNKSTSLMRQYLHKSVEAERSTKTGDSKLRQSSSEPQLAAMLNCLKRTSSMTPEMFLSHFLRKEVRDITSTNSYGEEKHDFTSSHSPYPIKLYSPGMCERLHSVQNSSETSVSNVFIPQKVCLNSEEQPCSCDSTSLYYTFRPAPGIKFISLDCFEVSVIGYNKTDPRYMQAADILFEHHGHEDFDGWDCADMLEGPQKRFQQMNGAVSEQQLNWLDKELEESDNLKEKVIVFGHVCLHPDSADWDCFLWNYESVLDIFHAHSCVTLYLCGHTHQNGYALDFKGIHYVVLAGIIETVPEETAFATIAVYNSRIEIIGHGRETSRTLWLDREESDLEPDNLVDTTRVQTESHSLIPSITVRV